MNYYEEIKEKLIDNEIYEKVKDYSKERNKVRIYYEVGELLASAGKHYGEGIIKEYSKRLSNEIGKGYGISNLKRMHQLYLLIQKGVALPHQLSWTHILILLPIKNIDEINYYINVSVRENLSYRKLRNRVKENNKYVIKYSSDKRIKSIEYSMEV